ncbi:MAG: hypothetical protein AAF603_04260 [Pseudomonadota bacterium]
MLFTRKTKIHILSVIGGALLSGLSLSSASAQCTSKGCKGQISTIYVKSNGDLHINTDQDETEANCTPLGNVYFTVKSGEDGRDMYLAMLLSAKAQNEEVYIRIIENSTDCEVKYMTM